MTQILAAIPHPRCRGTPVATDSLKGRSRSPRVKAGVPQSHGSGVPLAPYFLAQNLLLVGFSACQPRIQPLNLLEIEAA